MKERTVQGKSLAVPPRVVIFQLCSIPVFLLMFSAALCAQNAKDSWSDLNTLKAGQRIEVIESNMKHHGGEFVSVSDEMLTLQEKGSDVSVKRQDIVRVSTASGARRGEHTVIGLVVGAAGGAGIGAAAGSGSKGWVGLSEGVGALVGIAIGATSGAIVGTVIPAHTTIYRAAPAVVTH